MRVLSNTIHRTSRAIFTRVLRRYPAAYRQRYGTELERLFDERLERAAHISLRAQLRVAVEGCLDVLADARRSAVTGPQAPADTGDSSMTMLAHDVRLALRAHLRRPAFALMVILTLAISVGAVVTVMALINGAVLRPLPYPQPDRVVSIVTADPQVGPGPLAPPNLQVLREHTRAFDAIAGFSPSWSLFLSGREERVLTAVYVSDGAFEFFGVRPVQGHLFGTEEYVGRRQVAVVSESFWAREFGSDPLGSQFITLDEDRYSVVGIVSNDFKMPITASSVNPTERRAEVWLPFSLNPLFQVPAPVMHVVARLQAGSPPAQAEQELAMATEQFATAPARPLQVVSLAELVSHEVRRPLSLLMAAVVCLLLICTANIVGLVLARTSRRAGELAVRRALGASQWRLVTQLSVETGILAVIGSLGGVALAVVSLGALPALLVGDLPPSTTLAIDMRVVAAAVGLGLLCTLGIGVWPAVQAARQAGSGANQLTARHTAGGGARRTRQVLAVVEVALALTLLIGSGLMARSFWLMSTTDPGFDAQGLLATGISLRESKYPEASHRIVFVNEALDRLRTLPGVSSTGAVNRLPFGGSNVPVGIEIEGQPTPDNQPITMDRRVATPGYFTTMDMPLVYGRAFGLEDTETATERVVILNEAAARSIPTDDAIGRRLRLMLRGGPGPWLRVVGVVADVRHHGLGQPIAPEVYVPYAQASVESMVFVTRSATEPGGLAPAARTALKQLDPDMRVLEGQQAVVADLVRESVAEPRLHALLVNGFAGVALALATIGIVGIVSFSVAQERRNIGVRLALGAGHGQMVRGVVLQGMALVGLGIGLGLTGGLMLARLLEGLLFGVAATDVPTISAVVLLVGLVGYIAVYVPARRITAIEPIEVLRPE